MDATGRVAERIDEPGASAILAVLWPDESVVFDAPVGPVVALSFQFKAFFRGADGFVLVATISSLDAGATESYSVGHVEVFCVNWSQV